MGCEYIKLPDGTEMIVCSRGRRTKRCACGAAATLLCDAPRRPTGKRTCDAPLCAKCTTKDGPDRDLCRAHAPRPAGALVVYTARIAYAGADRLDVSRASGAAGGLPFAPSWAILKPALDARRRGEPMTDARWTRYVEAYTAEMRASYRAQRAAWDALLARGEVTLLCYCTDAAHCHRTALAHILEKLGAHYAGEREARRVR